VASAEFPAITGEDDAGHPAVREAVLNRALTHSGDPDLARHVGNAVVRNDSRAQRVVKEHRDLTRRIDLAVAAVMAFSVASTEPGPQLFVFDEADA
jgi:phage terminase large subunit-like protein